VAVAMYVLTATSHPTAEQVWKQVKKEVRYLSRATVYNTLNLLVERGLLRHYTMEETGGVFDPRVEPHHHFIDRESGVIHDIPWDRIEVSGLESLRDVEITDYMVVIRGSRKKRG
jgi:Fe2+ or Zn2+ uptake regulation protein